MSYDLFFLEPRISHDQFREYFAGRPHYRIDGTQAIYQNEDTGVYFLMEYNDSPEEEADLPPFIASLNLNFYRPHFFGLEAVDEVAAFIEHFGFSILDLQNEGMDEGPFSREGFLRGWNYGNEFGYSAILNSKDRPQQVFTYPTERLEAIWRWNLAKTQIQEEASEDRFIPQIMFMDVGGKAASMIVWPDAISELIPQVDFLFIGRDELAPRTLFGGKKEDQLLIPMADLAPDLEAYLTNAYALPAYELPAPAVPELIRSLIRGLKPDAEIGDLIPFDQVLNQEHVLKYRAGDALS